MKKQHSSTDGFILKRSSNQLNNLQANEKNGIPVRTINSRPGVSASDNRVNNLGQARPGYGMSRVAINESLSNIDDSVNQPIKKLSRRQRRRLGKRSAKRPRSLLRRIIKWLALLLLIVALAVGGYTAYKFVAAGNNVFQGSFLDIFNNQPLNQDANGRSNFLILGTSEDDPGHEGSTLTDTILVVSIDQTAKNAYMFSIPRDLYVQYGADCDRHAGKINYYFTCVNSGITSVDEQDRLTKTQKFIGDILGLDIQYGVHANYTVLKQAVDAVNGIDVDIQASADEPGILDRAFDYRCNYTCYLVKYDNGIHHLDGQQALDLARVRGDYNVYNPQPTYGLSRSNPDREIHQQKILIALKNKATSTGMLSNLGVVTGLIDALGNNLRTNIQSSEIRTLAQIASDINNNNIITISLVGDSPVVENTKIDVGGGTMMDIVEPVAGRYDYSDIQDFIDKNLSSNPVVHEAAPVVVLNGTDQIGLGQIEADKLTIAGFNVMPVENAPENTYTTTEIYQIGTGNNATASELSRLFGVTIKKTMPPKPVNGNVRFVIIIGAATS